MPDNTGNDDYEFVEVYNNTSLPIHLDQYKLVYETRTGVASPIDLTEDYVLASKGTAVIWLQTSVTRENP